MIRPETLDQKRRAAQRIVDEYNISVHIYRIPGSVESYATFSNPNAAPNSCTYVETIEPKLDPSEKLAKSILL